MDVTCERCSTEYEFDDALVSGRGTTVKCTTCGHQFKVRRSDGQTAPERWIVRTVDGRKLEFKALRELQSAIAHAVVTREDVLSRGGGRPRRLGSIAELDPFFANAGSHSVSIPMPGPGGNFTQPVRSRTPTPTGLGGAAQMMPSRFEGSVAIPLPIAPSRTSRDHAADRMPAIVARSPATLPSSPSVLPPVAPPPTRVATLPPPALSPSLGTPMRSTQPSFGGATLPLAQALARASEDTISTPMPAHRPATPLPPPPRAPSIPPEMYAREPVVRDSMDAITEERLPHRAAAPAEEPPTERAGTPRRAPSEPPPPPTPISVPRSSDSSPRSSDSAPHRPISSSHSFPPLTPTPSDVRSSVMLDDGYTEPRFSSIVPSKRTGGARLIVGIVVSGLVVFTAVTLGRQYFTTDAAPASSAAPSNDARVAGLLEEGEKSLLAGDLETAKESFFKASALAEADPRVAMALARLATIRTDVAWVRRKLVPDDDPDHEAVQRELEQTAARSEAAVEEAKKLTSNDPTTIVLRIDALRALGKIEDARKLVPSIPAATSAAESGLSRAALDLAEEKPDWPTVIDRLRAAVAAEQGLGRARSMLIYALARSGDASGARTELDRLGSGRVHPLKTPLRKFIDKLDPEGSIPAASASAIATAPPPTEAPPPAAEPTYAAPTSPAPGQGSPFPGGRVPDDYVAPSGTIDTSDLPGLAPPPHAPTPAPTATATAAPTGSAPAPAPTPPPPPPPHGGIDTTDLPGLGTP